MTEMAVAIGHIQLHWLLRLGPAASYFGELVFKAVRRIDAHAMLFLCDGIENGLAARVDISGHNKTGAPAIDVDLEIDLGEDWLVNFLQCARKDVEERRAWLRVQA